MGYKISDFSSISGISPANIRYYEQRGYPSAIRTESGYRQYGLEDSYRINTFNELLAHGFSVSEAITLLDAHPVNDLSKRLEKKRTEIEEQIQMLQKKLEWNHMVHHVFSHIDEEFRQIHEVKCPELCFLKCTECLDHAPSIENGEQIAKWVELLPLCHYAGCSTPKGDFSLGMIIEMGDAVKFGLSGNGTLSISEGEYYAMLLRGEEEEEIHEDPRIKALVEKGYNMPEFMLHVYLMFETTEYGGFLNYILLKK